MAALGDHGNIITGSDNKYFPGRSNRFVSRNGPSVDAYSIVGYQGHIHGMQDTFGKTYHPAVAEAEARWNSKEGPRRATGDVFIYEPTVTQSAGARLE